MTDGGYNKIIAEQRSWLTVVDLDEKNRPSARKNVTNQVEGRKKWNVCGIENI